MSRDSKALHIARVAPHRWAEEAKRAEVIERYLQIPKPTARDAEQHAEELAIKRSNFYRLVRAYLNQLEDHGVAETGRRHAKKRIDPKAEGLIQLVIDQMPNATLSDIYNEVDRRSREQDISPPSLGTVRDRFYSGPLRLGSRPDQPLLVLDHCHLNMAIEGPDGAIRPAVLTMLGHLASGRILGHHLASSPGLPSSVAALLTALKQPRTRAQWPNEAIKLSYRGAADGPWEAFSTALSSVGMSPDMQAPSDRSSGKAIMRLLGAQLGPIKLAPRAAERKKPYSGAASSSLDQATVVVAKLIEARNACLIDAHSPSLRDLLGEKHALVLEALLAKLLTTIEAPAQPWIERAASRSA